MDRSSSSFDALVDRFASDRLPSEDVDKFFLFLEQEGFRARYGEKIDEDLLEQAYQEWSEQYAGDALYQKIIEAGEIVSRPAMPTVHRVHFLKTAWFRYAAAIILSFGIGVFVYNRFTHEKPNLVTTQSTIPTPDIAPGGQRAVLTLADGSTINLDSAANGRLVQENGNNVTKKDGQVIYEIADRARNDKMKVTYNTMSTPKGGQFELRLPDGTHVWLNAASSITYPTAFTGNRREVSISGEAYFEVAKNKEQPFRVEMNGSTIEVLGTHFNVNAYSDEPALTATLLEGSIKIKKGKANQLLSPGQQAVIEGNNISLQQHANTAQAIAWKNGLFNFQDKNIKETMRELSRWYSLNVVYEPGIGNVEFGGEITMNLNLGQVLSLLDRPGLHFHIEEGNILRVSPH